jgi:hypothetical protein
MGFSNISAALTPAQITAINTAIATIKTNLAFIVNLTLEERQSLSKMGSDGYSYVTRALDYAQNNASALPPTFNLVEAQKDLKLANDLRPILQQIAQLTEGIDDTTMAAGIEAKDFADKFYEIAKVQAKMNVPMMDTIVADLATFYEKAKVEEVVLNTPPTP